MPYEFLWQSNSKSSLLSTNTFPVSLKCNVVNLLFHLMDLRSEIEVENDMKMPFLEICTRQIYKIFELWGFNMKPFWVPKKMLSFAKNILETKYFEDS